MITPRIKPSAFFVRRPATDLFVQAQREDKLGSYVVAPAKPRQPA